MSFVVANKNKTSRMHDDKDKEIYYGKWRNVETNKNEECREKEREKGIHSIKTLHYKRRQNIRQIDFKRLKLQLTSIQNM